jgi:hypothetical protein
MFRRLGFGYASLIAGLIGLAEMFADNILGSGLAATTRWSLLYLFVCCVVAGICNLHTTRMPDD